MVVVSFPNSDDEDENEDEDEADIANEMTQQEEQDELLMKLLDSQVDNEETLLALHVEEQLPQLVLQQEYVEDSRFDYICGLINLVQRLLQIDNQVIDQWMGIVSQDDSDIRSLFSFIFKIIDQYFERFCVTELIDFSECHFSLYDYLCSVICSLVMTLNEEQLQVTEDVLFESLFSSSAIRSLLASDIICFMCRTCKSPFTADICDTLFAFFIEVYVEDIQINVETRNQASILNPNWTQEVILNLLYRIIKFLGQNELALVIAHYPVDEYSYIWKRVAYVDEMKVNIGEPIYDKLCILSKTVNTQLSSSLVTYFVKSTEVYSSLLCLQLLVNMKHQLNFRQFSAILKKSKQLFSSLESLQYRNRSIFPILRLLNILTVACGEVYENEKFIARINELLHLIYQQVPNCFVSRLNFSSVLHNLSRNPLFTNVVFAITEKNQIKTQFKLHLKHYMQHRFMASEERELYVGKLKSETDNLADAEEIEPEIVLANANLLQLNLLNKPKRSASDSEGDYGKCKRIKAEPGVTGENVHIKLDETEQSDINVTSRVASQLQASFDLCSSLQSVSTEEKAQLVFLTGQLSELANSLVVSNVE